MPKDIILYYLILSAVFLIVAPIVSKKLMQDFVETPKIKKQTRISIGILIISSLVLALTVNPYFLVFTMFIGTGLIFQAFTGFCGLSIILSKIPWNKVKLVCEECKIK